MGANTSKARNYVREGVEMSVEMALSNSAACNTTVAGSNIIRIVGGRNIDISNIKQRTFIKMDTTCSIKQINTASTKQGMESIMKQKAEAMTSGLGLNQATSDNVTDLMLRMPVVIQNSMVAAMNALSTGSNLIEVEGVDGLKMTLIDQEVAIDTVVKATIDQAMSSSIAQEIKVIVDQSAKATAKGLDLTIGLVVFIVLVIAGTVILMSWKNTAATVLMSPMTWLLVLAPVMVGTATIFVAGIPTKKMFWPYKSENLTAKDKAMNKTIMLGSGIATGVLLVVEAGLFFAMLSSGTTTKKLAASARPTSRFWSFS